MRAIFIGLMVAALSQITEAAESVGTFMGQVGLVQNVYIGMNEKALRAARSQIKEAVGDLEVGNFSEISQSLLLRYYFTNKRLTDVSILLDHRKHPATTSRARGILRDAFSRLGENPQVFRINTSYTTGWRYILVWAAGADLMEYVAAVVAEESLISSPSADYFAFWGGHRPGALTELLDASFTVELSGDEKSNALQMIRERAQTP